MKNCVSHIPCSKKQARLFANRILSLISPADIRFESDLKFVAANYTYFQIPYWHQLSTTILYFKLHNFCPGISDLHLFLLLLYFSRFEGIASCFQLYFYCWIPLRDWKRNSNFDLNLWSLQGKLDLRNLITRKQIIQEMLLTDDWDTGYWKLWKKYQFKFS